VFIVANKVDSGNDIGKSAEFWGLGLGNVIEISAANGSGTGELLDEVVKNFSAEKDFSEEDELPKITVVGRPNVGKSSFINAITGEDRNIVTDISGTTRDAIHTRFNSFGFDFLLVDTAG